MADVRGPAFYLVFVGNGSTAAELVDSFETLAEETGRGFFIADYRGYGFNDGRPTEASLVRVILLTLLGAHLICALHRCNHPIRDRA